MDKTTKILKIEGMTCAGCENRIEKALKKLSGTEEVKAKFSDSTVEVIYDKELIDEKQIIEIIEKLDYKVNLSKRYTKVDSDKPKKSISNILQFICITAALVAGYILIQSTVGFNFIPQINQSMGYGMLFVIGLFTSLHCIAMCGGINISQCAINNDQDYKSKLIPSFLYNLGRVISYTLLGGIFGAFGSLISISASAKIFINIITGVLMLIMGLNMLNIFPWLKKLNPAMPKFLINKFKKGDSKKGPLYIGLLNGLMPCGPLQAMQIYALGTGSFISGSISMFVFSLGTVPLMFSLGALSSFLTSKFNHKMMKVSAILVIFLGLIMMNRGFSLSGISIIPSSISTSLEQISSSNIAVIQGNVQVVSTRLENGRYSPIIVQKGIPVKWTINVQKGELNGCNNPVTIPEYNITKKLVIGDNIIEFTPTEAGNIIYTCWMGMISSNIKVVDNLSNLKQSDLNLNDSIKSTPSSGGCACCGT